MRRGEWAAWAADGAAAPTPIWVTILVAAIAVAGPLLAYLAARHSTNAVRLSAVEANSTANRAVELQRDAAQQTNEIARHANALAASKSNRELIVQALELARSDDPMTREQGYALLDGLSRMPGLSPDDATLIQTLSRPQIESTLSQGRRLQAEQLQEIGFLIDSGEEGDDEVDHGDP